MKKKRATPADKPRKPPSAATVRERVKAEARGYCMTPACGQWGDVMASERDRFVWLCRKCSGRRAVGIREQKKQTKMRQQSLFGESE